MYYELNFSLREAKKKKTKKTEMSKLMSVQNIMMEFRKYISSVREIKQKEGEGI